MNQQDQYALFHPRWYRRGVSVWWWLESWRYTKFVLRELTSVFVAYFCVLCLWKLNAIATGPQAYAQFLARMKSPLFVFLNGVALFFVLFHAITWFNLAPKAMAVRVSGKRLPDRLIQVMNYLAWLIISAVAVWVLRRG